MEIITPSPDDWSRIRELRLQALKESPEAFGSTYQEEASNNEEAWREWVSGWAEAREHALFVATQDGRWLGLAVGVRWDDDPSVAHLYAMWVDPSFRRLGAGRALTDAVIDWASEAGADTLELNVMHDNAGALALYETCGFTPTGDTEEQREGAVALVMRRKLSRTGGLKLG